MMDNLPIIYIPNFIQNSNFLFDYFCNNLDWKSYKIKIFGKEISQPRLVSYYGDKNYTYSKTTLQATARNPNIDNIKNEINQKFWLSVNSVLCNLYRDGNDSMWRHADDELELGIDPSIVSVSFGATRIFKLKNKLTNKIYDIPLWSGDLLIMTSTSQTDRLHSIPKTKKQIWPRINLTFRKIYW